MDSIITIDQDPSVEMKSQSMHNHNNPFDVSLFEDNAKIRRIPLFAYDEFGADEDEYGVGNQVKLKN